MNIATHILRGIVPLLLSAFYVNTASAQDDSVGYANFPSSVSAVFGLEPIAPPATFPDSVAELRLHVSFDNRYPGYFMIIRQTGTQATGALHLWWPGSRILGYDPDVLADMREHVRSTHRCGPVREGEYFETCTAVPPEPPDWGRLLRELARFGIWDLPGQNDQAGIHGASVGVEFRRGGTYRSYGYWAPGSRSDTPEERAAEKIMMRAIEIFRQ